MADKNDEVLYECDCFRVLKYWDEDGQANVALSLYNHGIDVYLTEQTVTAYEDANPVYMTVSSGGRPGWERDSIRDSLMRSAAFSATIITGA